jgi:hypothetical protein
MARPRFAVPVNVPVPMFWTVKLFVLHSFRSKSSRTQYHPGVTCKHGRGYRRVGRAAGHRRVRPAATGKGHTLIIIARHGWAECHRHRLARTGSQTVTSTRYDAEWRPHTRRPGQCPGSDVLDRETVRLARRRSKSSRMQCSPASPATPAWAPARWSRCLILPRSRRHRLSMSRSGCNWPPWLD